AVVLAGAPPRHPFHAADLPFLEDTAARAAVAVAAIRDLRRQRQIAFDLQRALLPEVPPALLGLEMAARYVAGAADVDVGGDWWDITNLGAGRVGVGVGDVSGRGIPAAVIMGQLRSAMHAAARAALSPSDVLGLLDTHTVELLPDPGPSDRGTPPRFATSTYAVLEPYDGIVCVASAGHLPLLVRTPEGRVVRVAAPPGPPLGLGMGPFEEVEVPFPAGSLLVAFTDGLVEGRTRDFDEGIDHVAELLTNALEHAGAPVTLRAHVTSARLVVEVQDTSALLPRPTTAPDDGDGGRGLALVAALSAAWGMRLSRTGKTTWAELHRPA